MAYTKLSIGFVLLHVDTEGCLKLDPINKVAKENLATCYNNWGISLRNNPVLAIEKFHRSMFYNHDNFSVAQNLNAAIKSIGKDPHSFDERLKLAQQTGLTGDFIGELVEYTEALKIKDDPKALFAMNRSKEFLADESKWLPGELYKATMELDRLAMAGSVATDAVKAGNQSNEPSSNWQLISQTQDAIMRKDFASAKAMAQQLEELRKSQKLRKKEVSDVRETLRYLELAESLPKDAHIPYMSDLLLQDAQKHIKKSKELENQFCLSESLQELEESVQDNPVWLQNKVSFYQRHGRPDLAAVDARECLKTDVSGEAKKRLAQLLEDAGDLSQAEKVLQDSGASGFQQLAEFYARHRRYADALKIATKSLEQIETAQSDDSNNELSDEPSIQTFAKSLPALTKANAYKLRASISEESGDLIQARHDYESATQSQPNAKNYLEEGKFYWRRELYDQARLAFNRARDSAGNEPERKQAEQFSCLLDCYVHNQNIDTYLQELLARPNTAGNLAEKAQRSFWYGKSDVALGYINSAVRTLEPLCANNLANTIAPLYERCLEERAKMLEKMGRIKDSRADFDLIAKRYFLVNNLDDIVGTFQHKGKEFLPRARFFMRQKCYGDAEMDFTEAIRLTPSAAHYAERGRLYTDMQRYDLALQDFDAALGLGTSTPELLLLRADVLRQLRKGKCWSDYQSICSLGAHTKEDCHIRAKALLALGRNEEALVAVDDAIAYDRPNSYVYTDSELLVTKAKILYALGRQVEAQSMAQAAVKFFRPLYNDDEALVQAKTLVTTQPISQTFSPTTIDSASKNSEDIWALIVGVSQFANPKYNLMYSSKDAKDLREYLITESGLKPDHVKMLIDKEATKAAVLNAFGNAWLTKVTKPGDTVILYFSTHGTPTHKDVAGENYVVAHDTDAYNLPSTGIPMHFLYRHIRDDLATGKVILFLDTCYSGALTKPTAFSASETAQLFGRPVMCSSSSQERSWESRRYANGVFTRQLINSLRKKKDVNSIFDEVLKNVSSEVSSDEKGNTQTPQFFGQSFPLKL
jgi:tetratricopeptide (TPR) repeat protein